jgi:predicted RNA binding protein YcfA (HicA-like mRNA interferase family)
MRKTFGAFVFTRFGVEPVRCEIDDLSLMDAENTVRASRCQQRQVSKRAEAAITKQDVVFAKVGMDLRDPGHVVRKQRGSHNIRQHSRADMEQRQEMGYGEAAAGFLASGVTKVLLKFGYIGHREAGSISDEHAVSMPGSGIVDLRSELPDNATEQIPKQCKG